ncbi:MAG: hypothetical protein WBA93_05475 [Microcoleaceae cyanobacterium]
MTNLTLEIFLSGKIPKKVRELKQILQKAGFLLLTKRGKGSHS